MNLSAASPRIRPMAAADLDRVQEIAATLKDAPHWPLAAYAAALDPLATPRRFCLVAEEPAQAAVVGFAVASAVGAEAELESIAVAPGWQRRGVARLLFAALAAALRQAQASEVTLEVRASNLPALAFYRSLGFVECGLRPRYYGNPVEDAVLMKRSLE